MIYSGSALGQQTPGALPTEFFGSIEFGIVPRFSGISVQDRASRNKTIKTTSWSRIEMNIRILPNVYIGPFVDIIRYRLNTNVSNQIVRGRSIGLLMTRKFTSSSWQICLTRNRHNDIIIYGYPELYLGMGIGNLYNNYYQASAINTGRLQYFQYEYGITMQMYLNKWLNLDLVYSAEYFPHIQSGTQRYFPLKMKLLLKL